MVLGFLNRREHFGGVFLGLYLGPDFLNLPFWVDEKTDAVNTLVLTSHEFLFAPSTVSLHDFLVGIGEQLKRQLVLGDKFVVLGGGVAADAEHDGLGTLELGVFITERAGFLRSARRIVLGIEEKDDMFAL